MRVRVVGFVMIVVAAMTTVGVWVGAGSADAAAPPSVRLCATWADGKPYVGPVTLVTRDIFGPRKTLNTAPSGCMIYKGLLPHKAYQGLVSYTNGSCHTHRRADGSTFRYGSETQIVGRTPWKVTPRTGQVYLGEFTVHAVTVGCS
ncbi:hypothetical protein V1Y59_15135 [Gordonia sp. PKS22-38]|uniref:Secreted protein n=1 Tax=Gordonia prachuapensis TaxID=3115651 RepID=A0ABU7MVR5_9ACTN|nr:hypothetical protein [Gordonia sp. PKS22-38]